MHLHVQVIDHTFNNFVKDFLFTFSVLNCFFYVLEPKPFIEASLILRKNDQSNGYHFK